MSPARHPLSSPSDLFHLLAAYPARWLAPAAVVAVAAAVYAVLGPATWEASQGLIVRNDAANTGRGAGKFSQPEEMKTVQETILELVKSRGVLEAALREVGPPSNYGKSSGAWPNEQDIDGLRKHVSMSPPKGAEFGKTEVFYLEVEDHDRLRSLALNQAICDQLQSRFQQLRDAKAQSMTDELVKAVHLAKADLDESTTRLSALERQLGTDLAELRSLQDPVSDSALRRSVEELRGQLRENRTMAEVNEQLLAVLRAAQDDPGRLLATPSRLLESQPSLRRLKEGLVDAQLRTATLQGTMSSDHPRVISAQEAEKEIGRHLHDELAIAIRGVDVELRMNQDRQTMLDEQLAKATARLDRLAEVRATYANLVAENSNRATLVERAEQNLAEARAAHASAKAASLISRIDGPDAGVSPVTPSRATIVLLGIVGGLAAGFGVLLLTAPLPGTAADSAEANGSATPLVRSTAAPLLQANGNLTFKQSLEKIAGGSAR